MTGGGDLDEIEDEDADVMDDDELGGFDLNENDPDPTAGASDVGGVPGGVEPEAGQ